MSRRPVPRTTGTALDISVRAAFACFDSDSSGRLEFAELHRCLKAAGLKVSEEEVWSVLQQFDHDGGRGLDVSEAILSAGQLRLRPIVLTTVTTVFGLLPMAIGLGGKSAVWAPLAATIAFGLLFATATTLLVIPPVYRVFADLVELAAGAVGADQHGTLG